MTPEAQAPPALNGLEAFNRQWSPLPVLAITHPNDLIPGDMLRLGKRRWRYAGRTTEFEDLRWGQNEFVFDAAHDTGGEKDILGDRRIHSQSELEALIAAGFMTRLVPQTITIKPQGPTVRSIQ